MTTKLEFDNPKLASQLFGPQNQHLKLLAERIGVKIESRGNALTIVVPDGEDDKGELAGQVLSQLYAMIKGGKKV